MAAEIKAATDMAATDSEGAAERIAYLRARGVEIETPEERNRPVPQATGPPFAFVHVPADIHTPVRQLSAPQGAGDTLPTLLAPRFDDNGALDADTVERETASRLKNMMVGGSMQLNSKTISSPSAAAIQQVAAGGKSESYPLMQASAENGWRGVRLYIDEIGALRQRPRNARAEELAHAAGLAGLAIHGDAYVGRCGRPDDGSVAEHNLDFQVEELAHTSAWVAQARALNLRQAAQAGIGDTEHLPGGGDESGPYSWAQTDDDVEARRTAPRPPVGQWATPGALTATVPRLGRCACAARPPARARRSGSRLVSAVATPSR